MLKSYALVALTSYLLGSIPFGYILVKLFRKQDIRETGSGNIGATNVMRSGAKGLGIATLVLDALKGIAAIFLTVHFFGGRPDYFGAEPLYIELGVPVFAVSAYKFPATFAALFAILGHLFPVWLRFKGGKGVATALGVFLVVTPKAILLTLVVFLFTVAISRYISLGSILSAAIFPIATYWLYPELRALPISIMLSTASMLIIIKHHDNIRRLIAGTEHRLGHSKNGPSNDDGEDNG